MFRRPGDLASKESLTAYGNEEEALSGLGVHQRRQGGIPAIRRLA